MKTAYENPSCDDMWICEKYSYSELPILCQVKIDKGICKKKVSGGADRKETTT